MSSLFFLVTSTDRHILSSGHSFFLAMDCMMAVRKDWGLKKPASHTVVGRAKSVVQASSSWKESEGSVRASQCSADCLTDRPRSQPGRRWPGFPVWLHFKGGDRKSRARRDG